MTDLYRYENETLTPTQLFFVIAVEETCHHFGVEDVTAVSLVLLGQNLLPTRQKPGGTTWGTSVASKISRRYINKTYSRRILPTLTWGSVRKMRVFMTHRLDVFVGRAVPVFGWVLTGIDGAQILFHTITRYNSLVLPQDRVL
ncbi:STM2901 family protein [Robbsia andropogonis]|uniref:STM2901 family protein n=1 Tax=Robbsia andropogonis TaxID=28092 RepID=UPI002A6B0B1A|nr:hypothetical protein [Robbsia andropogonis]